MRPRASARGLMRFRETDLMRWMRPDSDADVDLAAAYAIGAERHVRVNFVASLDGAVTIDGKSAGLGSPGDRAIFHLLRTMADVILVGAGTVRSENYGGAKPGEGRPAPPIAVVSRSLDLDPQSRFFLDVATRPIVVTCAAAPAESRLRLSEVADVIVAGDADVDIAAALDELARRGLRRVLCEGGPHLLGALATAGRVDELCLTVAPVLAGGTAGRIVSGYLPRVVERMHLGHVLEEEGFLFLRYSTAGD